MDNDTNDAIEEGRRLLLDILPLFTSNPERVDSGKGACFQAYYCLICTEAKILEDLLKDSDTRPPQYADILGKILKLFETLVKPAVLSPSRSLPRINYGNYERLAALRDRFQDVRSNYGSLLELQSFLDFGDRQEQTRDIHWALIQCNKSFSDLDENLESWVVDDKLRKESPAYEVREYATILHDTLREKFPGCGSEEHQAKLCLARYGKAKESDSEIEFDMLFSTHAIRWQESKIGMIVERLQSSSSRVRFDSPATKKRIIQQEIRGHICGVVESTAKARGYLYMTFDRNRKIYKIQTPPMKRHTHLHDSISMNAVITKLEENRLSQTEDRRNPILGRKHKRIIAVLLAHALVQYCGGAWLDERWDRNSISFLRHSSGDRLVLSTNLKPCNPGPDLEAEGRIHPYPGILALAIVMLEMELGKTIETARSEQEDFDTNDEPNSNIDFNAAWKMFEDAEIQDDTIPGFKSAVEACLNFWMDETDPDDQINHRGKLYCEMGLRQKIYQEIVMPLERELNMSFPGLNLDDPLKFAFWDRIQTSSEQRPASSYVETLSNVLLKVPHSVRNSITRTVQVEVGTSGLIPHPIFFHDVALPVSETSRTRSKTWIEDYMTARDNLIDRIEYSEKFDVSRVRIAVLDTGIDWSHPNIRGAKERIVEWKNWAGDREDEAPTSPQQVHDDAGHGTHVTALLLKIAPDAKVYVGRVADRNGAMVVAEKIAEAIEYAVNTWEVDIITMSFGFRKPTTSIDKAIKYAFSRDVIMFAATSNDGGNEEVAFPASSYDNVIGVNSTDSWGGKSDFTPSVLPLSENFSTLGEAVESSWPKHLKQGLRQCRSGTSYATPIAAGTAANILFYIRMKLDNEDKVKDAATCRGMKKLLRSMSVPIGKYMYIRPWILWKEEDEDILAQIRTALK